jgi:AcrR family transcriptional regulator
MNRCLNNKGPKMLPKERIDPRVQRTKQLLVDAFIDLARQTDPHSLSIQQITEKATINRATFYAHFNDVDFSKLRA